MPSVEGCPQPRRRGRKVCLVGMKTGVRFGEAWKRNLCKAQTTDKRGAGLEFCQASSLPPPPPAPGSRAASTGDPPEARFVVCIIVACLRTERGGC